jgi:hypothetical protein
MMLLPTSFRIKQPGKADVPIEREEQVTKFLISACSNAPPAHLVDKIQFAPMLDMRIIDCTNLVGITIASDYKMKEIKSSPAIQCIVNWAINDDLIDVDEVSYDPASTFIIIRRTSSTPVEMFTFGFTSSTAFPTIILYHKDNVASTCIDELSQTAKSFYVSTTAIF